MGQKINPIGYRLGVRRDWDSVWFARGARFRRQVLADAEAREFIRKRFSQAMISKIAIARQSDRVELKIHTARPGMVIGKKGEDIGKLKVDLCRIFKVDDVKLDIMEVRQPEINAQLVAMNITSQLEKRVAFRRAMRRAVASAMRLNVLGVKIICSGRLNGAEIARTERYNEGRVPLHTLRAEIDYGVSEAHTNMGVVGVKVWIFRGEKYKQRRKAAPADAGVAEAAAGPAKAPAHDTGEAEAETPVAAEAAAAEAAETEAPPEPGTEAKAGEAEAEAPGAGTEEEPPAKAKAPAKKPAAKRKAPAAKKPAAKPAAKKPAAKPAAKKPAAKPAAKKPAAKRKPAAKPAAKRKAPAAKDAGDD